MQCEGGQPSHPTDSLRARRSRRLHYFSTAESHIVITAVVSGFSRTVEQPDRRIERRRAQVHVALRHRQVGVSSELLNRSRRRAAHRQVRAERVTEDVHPVVRQPRLSPSSLRPRLHDLPGERCRFSSKR